MPPPCIHTRDPAGSARSHHATILPPAGTPHKPPAPEAPPRDQGFPPSPLTLPHHPPILLSPSVGAWRSLASALQWGCRGRRFESSRPDHFYLQSNSHLAMNPYSGATGVEGFIGFDLSRMVVPRSRDERSCPGSGPSLPVTRGLGAPERASTSAEFVAVARPLATWTMDWPRPRRGDGRWRCTLVRCAR